MDSWIRGEVENEVDKYLDTMNAYPEGIKQLEALLEEISIPNRRDLPLGYHIGTNIRGKVIIARCNISLYGLMSLEINPRSRESIPKPFKRFCKP